MANFMVTGKILWGPCSKALCQVKKQQIKVKFWIWVHNSLLQHDLCMPTFFLQKSVHPTLTVSAVSIAFCTIPNSYPPSHLENNYPPPLHPSPPPPTIRFPHGELVADNGESRHVANQGIMGGGASPTDILQLTDSHSFPIPLIL